MPSRFEEPHAAAVKVFTVQWHKNCNDNPINTFTHARLAAFGISLSLAQKKTVAKHYLAVVVVASSRDQGAFGSTQHLFLLQLLFNTRALN